ncbi:hypothetical protein J2S74_002717 [Evansella vedderi]|uniref:Glycosyltransferase subfamily 4-like N-terminal domain-containing protein n=1 Tax=Evansella vedderi TaxID=38282 RepID=A0ABT9ZWJ5_9BACI|nr:glycosyltransferase [Evansella vedderi]MDQ0255335.1 hypothetical protein [Evansella vedderi]
MKKVLVISYFFPPVSAGQRSLKFVKYLPHFGWMPVVLAPEKSNYPKVDITLLKEIPDSCNVIRVKDCENLSANPYITINEFMKGWFPETVKTGLPLLERHDIDVIYSVSAPYISLLSGLALKRLTGKPLVIDLRDEWTTNPFMQKDRWKNDRVFNKKLEKLVLNEADAVISVTEQITNTLFHLSGNEMKNKFFTISNGFDPDDFHHINHLPKTNKFKICYMGSVYGHIRNVFDIFFQFLENSIRIDEIKKTDIEISLVGYLDNIRFPNEWALNDLVSRTGYVNHHTALKEAASSDLLLLLIDPKQGNQTVTSKIFELINLEKPILAIVPPKGAAAKIINETRTGVVIDSNNPSGAIPYVIKYLNAWKEGKLGILPNKKEIQKYDRRNLTKKLSLVMNELI